MALDAFSSKIVQFNRKSLMVMIGESDMKNKWQTSSLDVGGK